MYEFYRISFFVIHFFGLKRKVESVNEQYIETSFINWNELESKEKTLVTRYKFSCRRGRSNVLKE